MTSSRNSHQDRVSLVAARSIESDLNSTKLCRGLSRAPIYPREPRGPGPRIGPASKRSTSADLVDSRGFRRRRRSAGSLAPGMAGLKPSANLFALLEGNDAGDTDAVKAAELEANTPKNINKKQQPQQTVWKANVNTAAPASAAKNKKKKQPAGGKNKKPPPQQQQRVASSRANVNGAANAAKNHKQQQQPAAAFKAKTGTAAGSTANLTEELFGRAYPSARYLIYQNRKPKAPANEKDGAAAGGAEAQDKKGGQEAEWQQVGRSKRAVPPAPAQEQPPAPVKPLPPPPPPTSLDDFPSLK
ncbi:hypothetical protein ACP70R_011365 [Stipagrostis hirtigluma subsp. patula]